MKKAQSTAGKMISCPTCIRRFPLPKDVKEFPINLHAAHLAESAAYKEQAEGKLCQLCEESPLKEVTSFCCSCYKFFCTGCKEDHTCPVNGVFIDLNGKEEFCVNFSSPMCPKHPKQELALFCEDCKMLVCLYCAQTKHQNHEKTSIDEASEIQKIEIKETMSGVDEALDTMNQALQEIQEMREKVKVSAEEATNKINNDCDDLIQAIENRRKVLQRRCKEIAEGKDDVLLNQMDEISCLRKKLVFAQTHAESLVYNHTPEELLSVGNLVHFQLNQVMEKYRWQSMIPGEDDTLNIFLPTEPLLDKIEKFGHFPAVPDPSKCHIEGLEVPEVTVGKEKRLAVVLKDETGKPIDGNGYFQYHLRKVAEDDPDESILPKVKIAQLNEHNKRATLGFTPDQPGEYQLTIMVRNRPIADPCKIIAKKHKDFKNLQDFQITYKNVGGRCYGVAVDDNGTIYATDYSNHLIKIFRLDGTDDQIGGSDTGSYQFTVPDGIIILDNVIYVVCQGDNMIKMYSTDKTFIREFGGKGNGNGQFSRPYSICTDRQGRLLVADSGNNRVQVFTLEGNFIDSFSCPTSPYDVAVDPEGNVHVALVENDHIAVYSQDCTYRYMESYNLGGSLEKPTGICIDQEGNRLIGSCQTNKIYIADSTGEVISSRNVNSPWEVMMDKKGSIYVAEHEGRVSIMNYNAS